jgi:hypothetical protein
MNLTLLIITVGLVAIISLLLFTVHKLGNGTHQPGKRADEIYEAQTEAAVKEIFNDKFREELKNRGRLHFEKIIGENAMFLQQDLRLTTSQLNDYMKQEITKNLQEEFGKYSQSITDAKELAVDSIKKTQVIIEEQRATLTADLKKQISHDKMTLMKTFEDHMSDIVNHYLLESIGNQIDLTNQLEYILHDLETNKKAIMEDITDGA